MEVLGVLAVVVVVIPLAWVACRRTASPQLPAPPPPARASLRLMTYNVLGDGPLFGMGRKHSSYCALEFLKWSYRGPALLKQIKSYNADVINLQETQHTTMVSTFWPGLKDVYTVVHSTPYEGAQYAFDLTKASFIRNGKLEILRSKFVLYRKSLEETFATLGLAPDTPLWDVLIDRSDGCEVMILRDVVTCRVACVANVHLFWNPRHPDAKVIQAFMTLSAVRSAIGEYIDSEGAGCTHTLANFPIIVSGDFNSMAVKHVPDAFDCVSEFPPGGLVSGVYTLISTGTLAPTHPEHPHSRDPSVELGAILSPLPPLTSAYKRIRGADPAITTRVPEFEGAIDFVFVSDSVTVLDARPMPYEGVSAGNSDLDNYPPIPTSKQPSDHLPLGVDVSF